MNPVNIGSPVLTVYRITSVLKIVCSTTATVTIPSRPVPYRITAAGPVSHSPLPIDVPSRIAAGPIIRTKLPKLGGGGVGS